MLFARLGRTGRPAGRRLADAAGLDRHAARRATRHRRSCLPGHGERTTLGRGAREQPVPDRARAAAVSARSQPRAGPSTSFPSRRACASSSSVPRASCSRRRLRADRDADVRGHRAVRRAASASPRDIVQKEMYSFDDGGGRSLTLRPEGTAPVCRAYVEHGMHKLPAAGQALLPLELLPRRAPAGRPLPPVLAGRCRGARLRGPRAGRRVDRRCSRRCSSAIGVAGLRLRLSSLGSPATPGRLPRGAGRATCGSTRTASPRMVRERIDLNPLRAFDSDDAGTRAVMAGAPRLLDQLERDDAEHFAQVRELLDRAAVAYEIDSDARPRARLLHAHAVRVHQRRARRAVGGRRGRALRRTGRAARRSADARHRLGRRDRAGHACF